MKSEADDLFESLQAFDAAIKAGNMYPCCPRCNGSRTVSAMTVDGQGVFRNEYEDFNCPVCGATGEACHESGVNWLLRKLDDHELDDEQEQYLEDRKTSVKMET